MHVLLFFTYEISLKDWSVSGLLDREVKLYKKLSEYGFKFTFITYGDIEDEDIVIDNSRISVFPIYKYMKKSNNKIFRFFKSFTIPFIIKKNVKDFDIIKTNQLHGSWITIILKIITKKPLFVRTGYDHLSFAIHGNKKKYIIRFYYYLTKLSLKYCNIYSVTSKVDKDNLIKKFKVSDSARIKVIPNWIDSAEFNMSKYEDRLLAVGRLEKQKNYIGLMHELAGSPYTLDIVGDGSQKTEIISSAKENNVKINFLGLLDNDDLKKLYTRYKVFISSSLYEGNPKAILEAMSMGCVVVSSKIINVEEIVKDNENGRLFNFSNNELQPIIDEILTDEKKYKKLSKNAKETVQKDNNIMRNIKIELNLYDYLINC